MPRTVTVPARAYAIATSARSSLADIHSDLNRTSSKLFRNHTENTQLSPRAFIRKFSQKISKVTKLLSDKIIGQSPVGNIVHFPI